MPCLLYKAVLLFLLHVQGGGALVWAYLRSHSWLLGDLLGGGGFDLWWVTWWVGSLKGRGFCWVSTWSCHIVLTNLRGHSSLCRWSPGGWGLWSLVSCLVDGSIEGEGIVSEHLKLPCCPSQSEEPQWGDLLGGGGFGFWWVTWWLGPLKGRGL